MDRDIKFRVWESTSKRMGSVTEIHFGDRPHIRADFNGKETPEEKLLRACFGVKAKHILMQYTGLKDKNGKEIYEGDILSPIRNTGYKEPPKGLLCQVVWDEEWVSFKGLKDNKQDGEYTLTKGNAEKHWEIIGNIYENPELLK